MRHVENLIEAVSQGAKRGGLLLGAPGIGKTWMLLRAREIARQAGHDVAFVRFPGAGGLSAEFPLDEIVRQIAGPKHASVPNARTLLAELLHHPGRSKPMAFLFDDLPNSPAHGMEVLTSLIRTAESRILLLASSRTTTAQLPLGLPESSADLPIDQIPLGPLSKREIFAVTEQVLGAPCVPSLTSAIEKISLGNPLFIRELLGHWLRSGVIHQEAGLWILSTPDWQSRVPTLTSMLSHSLMALTPECRDVVTVMSMLGRDLVIEELCGILQAQSDECVERLSTLQDHGVIQVVDEQARRVRLCHPLIAETTLATVSEVRAAWWHGRIANFLESSRDALEYSAGEIVHHASRSLFKVDNLESLLQEAAQEAHDARDYRRMSRHYGELADRASSPERRHDALLSQATATLHFDPILCEQQVEAALHLPVSSAIRKSALLLRARVRRRLGRTSDALEDVDCTIALHGAEAESLHLRGVLLAIQGDTEEAERTFQLLASTSDDADERAKALGHLGQVTYCGGGLFRGLRLTRDALLLATDEEYVTYLSTNLAWKATLVGQWEEAEQRLRSEIAKAARAGDLWNLAHLAGNAAKFYAWKGNLPVALDYSSTAIAHAVRLDNLAARIDAAGSAALALLEASAAVEATRKLEPLLAERRGTLEPRELSFTYTTLGEAWLVAGDLARAAECVREARENLKTAKVWEGAVDRLEAQVELAAGRPKVAVAILRPWVAAPTAVAFEQARILEVAAQAYRLSRDTETARSCARASLDAYERLGASKRRERLEAWMKDAFRGPGRPRMRLPGGLTEREHEVLRHVITGKTNKDIARALTLSVSTVNKHVEHIITKAGVARRTELVAYAQRLDQGPTRN